VGVGVRRVTGTPARLLAAVLLLAGAVLLAAVLRGTPALSWPSGAGVPTGAAAGPPAALSPRAVPDGRQERARQVTELLDRRAAALLARDRDAFLAGLDPAADGFRDRQAALFDALAEVPLVTWRYEVDPVRSRDTTGLPARHGGEVWVPQVVLRYSFAGVPGRPTVATQVLTFVDRGGRWLLASDSDLDSGPVRTARALWDSGPVVAVRGRHTLALGHPESRPALLELVEETDAAVPRVTGVWGSWAEQVVVVLPRDEEEMRLVVGDGLDLAGIAAVATAQLAGGSGRYDPVGDRVIVHPGNYPGLGPLGERIVLTHEVAHVAARQVSGPALPMWLAEGLADYAAYDDAGVPLERAAPRTAGAVRAGDLPGGLPTAAEFAGADVARAYESAWLAVLHLVDRHGEDALLRLYRQVGSAPPGADPDAVVAEAFADVLGTTPAEFTAGWRDDLLRRFS
jgi:hypothetical protein